MSCRFNPTQELSQVRRKNAANCAYSKRISVCEFSRIDNETSIAQQIVETLKLELGVGRISKGSDKGTLCRGSQIRLKPKISHAGDESGMILPVTFVASRNSAF